MSFPVGYSEIFLPKIFMQALSFLAFMRAIISSLFSFLGLSHFLEPQPYFHEHHTDHHHHQTRFTEPPVSAVLIRELLPATKFSDLDSTAVGPTPESCALCLYEIEGGDEIRPLLNCRHIFHRICLDRWMDHDGETCPLCRQHLVPPHLLRDFTTERLCN